MQPWLVTVTAYVKLPSLVSISGKPGENGAPFLVQLKVNVVSLVTIRFTPVPNRIPDAGAPLIETLGVEKTVTIVDPLTFWPAESVTVTA